MGLHFLLKSRSLPPFSPATHSHTNPFARQPPWLLVMSRPLARLPYTVRQARPVAASRHSASQGLVTTCVGGAIAVLLSCGTASAKDFSRVVRPILSDHCFACHGPDEDQRQAGLRLDTEAGLSDILDEDDPSDSLLLRRILAESPDEVMPPPDFGKPLSDEQRTTLADWVASGGTISGHWAYQPEAVTAPPENEGATAIDRYLVKAMGEAGLAPNVEADRRTLVRRVTLDLTGLPPTPAEVRRFESDSRPDAYERLVDRLLPTPAHAEQMARHWLDLVRYADTHGLHLDNYREMWPYREWVIAAVAANMPYDRFVTEQLAGDRLADGGDSALVASGFNRLNVTTAEGGSIYEEVLARNVMDRTDAFGTIFLGLTTGCAACHDHKFDPISARDYYSLSAYFNSLDGSALDQNAKDPPPVLRVPDASQRRSLAEFDEALRELRGRMSGPLREVDQAQRAWERSVAGADAAVDRVIVPARAESGQGRGLRVGDDGEVALTESPAAQDTVTLVAELPRDAAWQTLRLEALAGPDERVGASENGNAVLSEIEIATREPGPGGEWLPVPILRGFAGIEQAGEGFAIRFAHDGEINDHEGWAVAGHERPGPRTAWFMLATQLAEPAGTEIRVKLHFRSKYAGHQFRRMRLSLSDSPPTVPEDQRVTVGEAHVAGPFPIDSPAIGFERPLAATADGGGRERADETDGAEPVRYEGTTLPWNPVGDLTPVAIHAWDGLRGRPSVTFVRQRLNSPSDQRVTLLLGADDGHVVTVNGAEIGRTEEPGAIRPLAHRYELPLVPGENRLMIRVVNRGGPNRFAYAYRSPAIAAPGSLRRLLRSPPESRSPEDAASIRQYYRQAVSTHPRWMALLDQERGLEKARRELEESFATTLIWRDTEEPRPAHVLIRGQYDRPGPRVERGTPAFLPPLPPEAPADRLGLAQWLLAPGHPLTARVAVNRYWQQFFGVGLVKTSEDFGSQGEPPSHPELLDWLAVDFKRSGWDVRRLVKSLVMSQAYRRSAVASAEALEIDPENRLLARGPRNRLDAEVLRDQALALSGLLVSRVGGPSVKPPQPDGLWYAVGYTRSNTARFRPDEGAKVYRRSLYTFWKRTSPPPQMAIFDAPSRESCTARRERTNTPMQALVLMNDPQFMEAARGLARRLSGDPEAPATVVDRGDWLFEMVTSRRPTGRESAQVEALFDDLWRHYRDHPQAAERLVGEASPDLAAWAAVASTLLNLDEVVTN